MKRLHPRVRKTLSADGLLGLVRKAFERLGHTKPPGGKLSLADGLMAAFAMFSLKDSSLLQFDKRRQSDQNLKTIYRLDYVPCDTRMREVLDPVEPDQLRPVFNDVLRELQRGKVLKRFEFLEGKVLLALDGVQHFSSDKVHCDHCQQRVHRDGRLTYHHQMVGAAIVHPDLAEVIPLAPEPICRQDGQSKNDCERNATRRLLRKFRQEHPHLKVLVIEDALSSNAPHLEDLIDLGLDFLLGVKPGDHEFLYEQVIAAWDADRVTTLQRAAPEAPGGHQECSFVDDLPLNASHPELRVTWLSLEQFDGDGQTQKRFDWVTQLQVTRRNGWEMTRGGRARWKIENETFNTLKNQGYHYEHNYGHGQQHLSSVLAMLMMLAFLVDQSQQLCCRLFQAVHKKCASRKRVWELQRSHFYHFTFPSMRALYWAILNDLCLGLAPPSPAILDSS
jgi:hypothetical protein